MSLVTKVLLNWKILLFGFMVLVSVSIINTQLPIVPVNYLTFIISTVFVWFISVCITFICLHKLLQRNEPVEVVMCNKWIRHVRGQVKPNPDNIKALCEDIDKYFINKWYQYVTRDESFPNESKVFLSEVISRLLEMQLCIDTKVVLHGALNIYLRHLKEFRRSLRRQQKYNGSIEELYRYSHLCSTNNRSKDYFLHQLTNNVLRHFINSELWNSLPCQVVVSILARKLLAYILKMGSNPDILNYVILSSIASSKITRKYDLDKYARIKIVNIDNARKDIVEDTKEVESNEKVHDRVDGEVIVSSEIREEVLTKKVENSKSEVIREHKGAVPKIYSDARRRRRFDMKKAIDIGEEPLEGSKVVSDPVKIYEPKNHKSTKTWSDSKDLALGVSLGQDPLDLLNSESVRTSAKPIFITTAKSDQDSSAHTANQFLNEVKHTTQTTVEDFKKSIKPISDATVNTLHNIKDLQESTMNNALHKIGDFQDEAAGMVEGILDFGRAGLRKGLRLTGLQDNIDSSRAAKASLHQAVRPPPPPTSSVSQPIPVQGRKKAAGAVRLPSSELREKSVSEDSADNVWMNPLQLDSPNFDGQILLEKPASKGEAEEPEPERRKEIQIPSISTEEAEADTRSDSPEPEYEDTADLAASIAKLRSLLQQRSSESSLSTPALSPIFLEAKYYGTKNCKIGCKPKLPRLAYHRPPDADGGEEQQPTATATAAAVSQRPPFAECGGGAPDSVDGGETTDGTGAGVMPTFYKFCAKTATGVLDKTLHTFKTALPGNPQGIDQTDNAWIFVQAELDETDIFTRMKKLLTERKEFCTLDDEIDTAYEAIDSLDTFQLPYSPSVAFEDELDAFEVKMPVIRAVVDIICELLADTGSPFVQEPIVKGFLLTFGPTLEHYLVGRVDGLVQRLCVELIRLPDRTNQTTLDMEMQEYVDAVLDSLPDSLKMIVGKRPLSQAVSTFVSSMQTQTINQDVALQLLELLALKLIEECSVSGNGNGQLSPLPPASASASA